MTIVSFLHLQNIPGAPHRMNQFYIASLVNFPSQITDIDVNYVRASGIVKIPQMLLQPVPGEYDSLILYHIPEKGKLLA